MRRSLVMCCGVLLLVQPAVAEPDYAAEVRPILARHCFACHGADPESRAADLRLDIPSTSQDAAHAIVPGRPADSELIRRIGHSDPELRMPPSKSGPGLTPAEIQVLTQWIAAGASYQAHWAFVAPVRPAVPDVTDAGWCRSDLDRFVLHRMQKQRLQPSEEADAWTLVRRVSLDLTGLPPTPDIADRFAADPSDASYEQMVDELLQSPRFGEHWASMWLDLARYADTKGYEKDLPRDIWRYRDWVIDAFNSDMPYDQFTCEQLAGDLLENATTSQILATAFHRNTMTNDEGGTDNEEFRIAAVKDRVDTTVQVWMGLTAGCAKCHSHKYDPISQVEYYQLMSFFNQTQDADRPDDSPRLATPTPTQQRRLQQLTEQQAALQSDNTDSAQAALKALTAQLKAVQQEIVQTPVMRELPPESRRTTHVHIRGNFLDLGDAVSPGFPEAFASAGSGARIPADGSRLSVAQWLMSDSNPLTARVAVNRVWSRFFGRGLVETEEDFGTQGSLPSHPELLDWLALEFRETHRWSFKQLCRAIVLSAVYRQSSIVADSSQNPDRVNRWLSRGPRVRLSAEVVRDQALAAAGLLSEKMGGPSVMPPQPPGLWRTTYSKLKWETSAGEDRYRRALYTFLRRTSPYPSLISFDATSREVCQIRRIRTNTPLQALVLMNDPVYLEAAAALADSARRYSATTLDEQLRLMFRRVLIRPPADAEILRLKQLYHEAITEYRKQPESAGELLAAASISEAQTSEPSQLAALTMVATVLLNLDETVTKP